MVTDKVSGSPQEFVDYRDRNQPFSAVATYRFAGSDLTGAGDAERILTAKARKVVFIAI